MPEVPKRIFANDDIPTFDRRADYPGFMNEHYPEAEWPWGFFFNGVSMPKYGACWGFLEMHGFDELRDSWDSEVGPRDIDLIKFRMAAVGNVRSADPRLFRYAVQEVLCHLFEKRDLVQADIRQSEIPSIDPDEVYYGLVEAAFTMRDLASRDGHAFWVRGYEADRLNLVEEIRRAQLPADHPEHAPPPHVVAMKSELERLCREQVRTLHRVAASGGLSKELRTKLLRM